MKTHAEIEAQIAVKGLEKIVGQVLGSLGSLGPEKRSAQLAELAVACGRDPAAKDKDWLAWMKELKSKGIVGYGPLPQRAAHAIPSDPEMLTRIVRSTLESPDEQSSRSRESAGKSKQVVIGKCALTSRLGRGGMGTVYRARHTDLDIDVAVKVLNPKLIKRAPNLAERFVREARIAAKLDHQNIVRVLDCGRDGPYYYLVMPFIDGGSVQKILDREGTVEPVRAVEIALAVCHGLKAALRNGIIHRDIKPDNIMLTSRGEVKLADLGLAKAIGAETLFSDALTKSAGTSALRHAEDGTEEDELPLEGLTRAGMAMGTPQYMSPEQCKDARSVDHRADVYSLGVTLYHMLAGRRPFEATKLSDLIDKIIGEEPVGLRTLNPDLPPALEKIVERMMAKSPGKRFRTYDELIAALEACLPSVRATAETVVAPTVKRPRLSRVPLLVGAAVAAALVLAGVMLFSLGEQEETKPTAGQESQEPVPQQTVAQPPMRRKSALEESQPLEPGPSQDSPPGPPPPTVPEDKPKPRPAPVAVGTVVVQSTPRGAHVALDGKPQGTAPLELEIEPGRHAIAFTLDGYQSAERTVELKADQEAAVTVTLVPLPCLLTLRTNVGGVRITLVAPGRELISDRTDTNGRWKVRLPPGHWEIIASKDGYYDTRGSVEILPGASVDHAVKLAALTSAIRLTTKPAGIELFLGGKRMGRTPVTAAGLAPGKQTVRLRDAGGYEVKVEMALSPGWTISRTIDFAQATRPERDAYGKLVEADKSGEPERKVYTASAYLRQFPEGTRRTQAQRIRDAAADLMKRADTILALARDESRPFPDRLTSAQECLNVVSKGLRAAQARDLIADIHEEVALRQLFAQVKDSKLSPDERARRLEAFARGAKSFKRKQECLTRAGKLRRTLEHDKALAAVRQALATKSTGVRARADICAAFIAEHPQSQSRREVQAEYRKLWRAVQKVEEAECFNRVQSWMRSKAPLNAKREVLEGYLRYFPKGADAGRVKAWLQEIERKLVVLGEG